MGNSTIVREPEDMDQWKGRVAVVTGASAGIGAAITEDLVANGMEVVGIARREDRLMELKKKFHDMSGKFHAFKADVTKEDEVKAAFSWIKNNLGGVDVLVNNAGICIKTFAIDCNEMDWRRLFDVNVIAVGSCTREVLKSMKERQVDDGHIININSVSSHQVCIDPGLSAYCASKFASKAITEGTRLELAAQGSKIKVTSISPGLVITEIAEANKFSTNEVIASYPHLQLRDVVAAVNYALSTPPGVQVDELILRNVLDV